MRRGLVLAIPILATLGMVLALGGPAGAQESESAEERLTARHAPILMMSIADNCFPQGGYDPAPVELVLEQPANALYDDDRRLLKRAPGAADVHGGPRNHFIDWPGDAKNPGCGYELRYRLLRENRPSVTYAHVASEEGTQGVAVQYWFFYYYNDFLNLHEGDWEMIQVIYDEAETAENALSQQPTRLAYSGHAGGEQASWSDRKVHKDGDRPIVFVARGSHASYFEPGTYLGVAKAGTVFGCDPVEPPFRRVSPEIILLPERANSPNEPFAWIEYDGGWGEERGDYFSGPTGPKARQLWTQPISWTNDRRDFSEKLADDPLIGLDPLGPVCTVIGWGSQALIWYWLNPLELGAGALGAVIVCGAALGYGIPDRLTRTGRRRLAEEATLRSPSVLRPDFLVHPRTSGRIAWTAVKLYLRRPLLFVGIGALFIPLAALLGAIQGLLGTTWLEDRLNTALVEPVFMLVVSSLGALVATIFVGGATAAAISELNAGRSPTVRGAYSLVLRKLASLTAANAISTSVIVGLILTVIGIPLAANRLVSWAFITQEVMLRDANAVTALHFSGAHVSGNWWRCLGILVWVALLITIPGLVIAFAFLAFTEPPVTQSVHTVNMLLYAGFLLPFAVISLTLLYGDLMWRREALRRSRKVRE